MGRRVGENLITNQFAEVGVHQELERANERIEELASEIERLKASGNKEAEEKKVVELRTSLQKQGILALPVSSIEPNPEQPRRTFNDESITLLARSLESDGQQQPILVLEKSATRYFLFDGERRWRAAQKLDWETIEAVIVPKRKSGSIENPEMLRRQALLANHHREGLNPLDLAEALVKEIVATQGIEEGKISKLLDAALARLTRKKLVDKLTVLVSLSSEKQELGLTQLSEGGAIKNGEKNILQLLLSLQLNPTSVKANIFPSLKLFDDLKDAIRSQGLGGHHAKILQQLSSEKLNKTKKQALTLRQRVTKEVAEKKLSVAATRKRVAEELARANGSEKQQFSKTIQNALCDLVKIKIGEDEDPEALKALESALKEKLKEISKVLGAKTK